MTATTLEQVQHQIDQLTPLDQVRLLEYLTPRIVRAVTVHQSMSVVTSTALTEAWQTFFRIGDALTASDRPSLPTLTQTVQSMRR
jgi:hypothetical protein